MQLPKISTTKYLIHLLSTLLCLSIYSSHADDAHDPMRGKAFSDPKDILPMPEAWQKQTIEYAADIKKAPDLVLSLDQQLYFALLPIIQEYAERKQLQIAIEKGTCGISSKALKDKKVDIAGFCCPPSPADRLPGLQYHTMGISPLHLYVHPENPIDNITAEQAQKIFVGETFLWSDVDKNYPKRDIIQVIGRLHCKQRPGHWRLLLDHEDLFSPRMDDVASIPDMLASVATNRNAVGYETASMAYHNRYHKRLKSLKINGAKTGNADTLVSGQYPLYRTFSLTTWNAPHLRKKAAEDLLKYLQASIQKVSVYHQLVSAEKLRAAGWKFRGSELIGSPH